MSHLVRENSTTSMSCGMGKIANPTVHVALNQIRVVVNAIVKKYGHPHDIVVEVARDLKIVLRDEKRSNLLKRSGKTIIK